MFSYCSSLFFIFAYNTLSFNFCVLSVFFYTPASIRSSLTQSGAVFSNIKDTDPSFEEKYAAIDTTMTWGYGTEGVMRAFTLLLRPDVQPEEKVNGLRVLVTRTADQQEKSRLVSHGIVPVMISVLVAHWDHTIICTLCFKVLSDILLVKDGVESAREHHEQCLGVLLAAYPHPYGVVGASSSSIVSDMHYLTALSRCFSHCIRPDGGVELLVDFQGATVTYDDDRRRSSSQVPGVVETLTHVLAASLDAPLPSDAACHVLRTLEAIATSTKGMEDVIAHSSIPVVTEVLQRAHQRREWGVALSASQALLQFSLMHSGKAVASTIQTLSLLSYVAVDAVDAGQLEVQRTCMAALGAILIDLRAKDAMAKSEKETILPLVTFLKCRVSRPASADFASSSAVFSVGGGLSDKQVERYRTDSIENAIHALRIASEHPTTKAQASALLANEPELLQAVYKGTDLLHSYGSTEPDKIPKHVVPLLT